MSRPPPPPSPPQPQTRKRYLKQRDEGEPLSNLRRTAPARQKKASAAITKTSDSDAQKLSPHKRKPKHGLAVAKYSPNPKSSGTRFQGRIVRGLGDCLSPAVEKGASYLGRSENVEELNVIEGFGDNEDDGEGLNHILSCEEIKSLPRTTGKTVSRACSHEAKSEEVDDPSQQTNASIDDLVRLLTEAIEARAQARLRAKVEVLIDELIRMRVAEKRGDDFFVSAMKYLWEGNRLAVFMALCNDSQKWMYLKMKKN